MIDIKALQVVERMNKNERDRFKPDREPTAPSQELSVVEKDMGKRILPPTYRARYEKLKETNPAKAQELWDLWSFVPSWPT